MSRRWEPRNASVHTIRFGLLRAHNMYRRVVARLYARGIAPELIAVGAGTTIHPAAEIYGTYAVSIGDRVNVHRNVRIDTAGQGNVILRDRVYVGPGCTLTASRQLEVGESALLASNCHVSTRQHRYEDHGAIRNQGHELHASVSIGPGAWLASNVVVLPGVSIGAGAIVGANSVVTEDVPARAVAVGAPARVVKVLGSPSG